MRSVDGKERRMSKRWSWTGLMGLALAAAVAPATLAGSDASRQDPAELEFTAKRAHSATGASLLIDYVNPNDPDAKPFAVDRVDTVFRRGTKIDTAVPAQCDEARASALPRHQCPPGSRVGGGVVHFDQGRGATTPPPRILKFELTLFNAPDQVLFRLDGTNNQIRGLVAPAEVRRDRRIRSEIPPLPGGSPDNQTAVDFFQARYREVSNRRGNYITTPGSCRRGSWTNHFAFFYNDDADPDFEVVQRPRTRSACTGR